MGLLNNDVDVLDLAEGGFADESREAILKKAGESLFFFAKAVCGYDLMTPHLHKTVCKWLVDTMPMGGRGILMPRSHYKSTILKAYILWKLVKNTDLRVLFVGESDTVASKNLNDIKWNIQANQLFRWLYPHMVPETFERGWTSTSIVLPRSRAYDEPTILSAGVGAKITGLHFDIILYDDIIGLEAARSPAEMQAAINWFELAPGLVNDPAVFEELIIGTRWKEGTADLYGWIMEKLPYKRQGLHREGFVWYVRSAIEDEKPIFPEKFSMAKLDSIRRREGDYQFSCTPAGSPILMADWGERPIEQVKPGDRVVGFTLDGRPKLTEAVVQGLHVREAEVLEYTLESGKKIRSTADHRWFTGRRESDGRKPYTALEYHSPVRVLFDEIPEPSADEQRALDYIAGIIDGEGAINAMKGAGSILVCQSPGHNPGVAARISEALEQAGIAYTVWDHYERSLRMWSLQGGRRLWIRLLRYTRMGKRDQLIAKLQHKAHRIGRREKVIEIRPLGVMPVYALQTTTGNYISQQVASSNCQFLNNPSNPEGADFPPHWVKSFRFSEDFRAVLLDGGERVPFGMLTRVSVYDPSAGGKTAGAENAILIVGMDSRRRVFVLEAWSANCAFGAAIEKWHALADKWRTYKNYFEAVGAHKAVAEIVRLRKYDEPCETCGKSHRRLNPVGLTPNGGQGIQSKEERIRSLAQPAFEEGRVFLKEGMEKLRKQITTFPHSNLVDQFDALAYAISLVRPPIAESHEVVKEHRPRTHTGVDYGGYS